MRTLEQTTEEILNLAAAHFKVARANLQANDDLFKKLGIDSLQALELLNDIFIRDRAADFANRLMNENSASPEKCVAAAFRLALSRAPSDVERQSSIAFIDRQLQRRSDRDKSLSSEENKLRAMTDFCQAIFGLNEFIYVD